MQERFSPSRSQREWRAAIATTGQDPVFHLNWEVLGWAAPTNLVCFTTLPFSIVEEKLRGWTLDGSEGGYFGRRVWVEFLLDILKLDCKDSAWRWDTPFTWWLIVGFSDLLDCRHADFKRIVGFCSGCKTISARERRCSYLMVASVAGYMQLVQVQMLVYRVQGD